MKRKFPRPEMKLYGELGARVHLRLIQGCVGAWTEGEQLQRPDGPESTPGHLPRGPLQKSLPPAPGFLICTAAPWGGAGAGPFCSRED